MNKSFAISWRLLSWEGGGEAAVAMSWSSGIGEVCWLWSFEEDPGDKKRVEAGCGGTRL